MIDETKEQSIKICEVTGGAVQALAISETWRRSSASSAWSILTHWSASIIWRFCL